MEEQITYQQSSGSTEQLCLSLPSSVSLSSSTSVSAHSSLSLLPPPSLALLLRAAVYERVSWVWLHCSVEKGRAVIWVRCAEGWCTRRNAFTRCVNLYLHALVAMRVWHMQHNVSRFWWQVSIVLMRQPSWMCDCSVACLFRCHLYRFISVVLHILFLKWCHLSFNVWNHMTFVVQCFKSVVFKYSPESQITTPQWASQTVQHTASSVLRLSIHLRKNYP